MVPRANVPIASSFSGFSLFLFLFGYVKGFLRRRIGPSQDHLSYKDRNKQEIADVRSHLLWDLKNLCPSGRGSTGLKPVPPPHTHRQQTYTKMYQHSPAHRYL